MRFALRLSAGVALVLASFTVAQAAEKGVPVEKGVATLSPENTKIQFVGTHAGAKPDPRTGGFAKFSGQVKVDPATSKVQSVSAQIDTTSVFTEFPKLTDHLKTADFFEVREYPTAKFESTKVESGKNGELKITGNLTLHGKTKEISFPATVKMANSGLTLKSEFSIDRSEFGITFATDKVDKKVSMMVVVGEKTETK